MKLQVVLILGFLVQSYAVVSQAQTNRLNLQFENNSLKEVLQVLEDQTDFSFVYKDELISSAGRVTASYKEKSITEILQNILSNQNLTYTIKGKAIVILPTEQSGRISQNPLTVKGKVTDISGFPLPGVTIMIKGTSQGTVTDADGVYSLIQVPGNASLIFSFVGMKIVETTVAGKEVINVVMEEESINVNEVVVTALGLEREKKALGYSVGEVKSDMLERVPQQNLLGSLFAKVSGLKISNSSNDINAETYVTIRGLTSLVGNNSPLVVIDGVPNDNEKIMKDLNAENIESVSILKGPGAAALYGSRAGNGVILITSKTGKMNKAGIGVSVNVGSTFSVPYKYVDLQNRFTNGRSGAFNESAYQSWYGPEEGQSAVQWNTNGESKPLVFYDNSMKDYFKTGMSTVIDLSVAGSSNRGNYRFSVSRTGGEGVFPGVELKRNEFALSAAYDITQKLKISTNISISNPYSDNYHERDGDQNGYTSI